MCYFGEHISLLTHPERADGHPDPSVLLSVLLLLSSVPSYAAAVVFLTQVQSPDFSFSLWSFAREGGACMRVCVGVFTHAFATLKPSPGSPHSDPKANISG